MTRRFSFRRRVQRSRRSLAVDPAAGVARRRDPVPVRGRACYIDNSFGDIDGVRPPRAAVECLKASLAAEKAAAAALAVARDDVRRCLHEARQGGAVTYTAIATAITPPKDTVAASIRARRLVASALACRAHEARLRAKRQRQE